MVYLPINVQRRLLEGVILPLITLATIGLWALSGRVKYQQATRWLLGGLVLALVLPSSLLQSRTLSRTCLYPCTYVRSWYSISPSPSLLFWTKDESAWLHHSYTRYRLTSTRPPRTAMAQSLHPYTEHHNTSERLQV